MKKISLFALAGVLMAGASYANFQPTAAKTAGGFVDGAENIVTVKQVMEMRDEVPVVVKGKILKRLGDDKYLFEDSTGTINVEIDKEDWRGITVGPEDMVKLVGEVDAGWFKTEIDVDYVEKVAAPVVQAQ